MAELLDEIILEEKAVELDDCDDMAVIVGKWWFVVSGTVAAC